MLLHYRTMVVDRQRKEESNILIISHRRNALIHDIITKKWQDIQVQRPK